MAKLKIALSTTTDPDISLISGVSYISNAVYSVDRSGGVISVSGKAALNGLTPYSSLLSPLETFFVDIPTAAIIKNKGQLLCISTHDWFVYKIRIVYKTGSTRDLSVNKSYFAPIAIGPDDGSIDHVKVFISKDLDIYHCAYPPKDSTPGDTDWSSMKITCLPSVGGDFRHNNLLFEFGPTIKRPIYLTVSWLNDSYQYIITGPYFITDGITPGKTITYRASNSRGMIEGVVPKCDITNDGGGGLQ